jgi:spore germination protein
MEKLNSRQLIFITCSLILNTTLISTPMLMAEKGGQTAIFSYLVLLVGILFLWWLLCRTMNRFPGRDLFEVLIERFGLIGRFITLLYIMFFFLILTRDIRTLVDFVNYTLLPMTPMVLITLLCVCTIAFIAQGRAVLIGRLTEIYQLSFIIIILLLPALLVKEIDWQNAKPLTEHGVIPIFQAGWYAVAYLGEIVAIPFLVAYHASYMRKGMLGILLGVGLLELLFILAIFVLNPDLTSRFVYPYYHLIREIRITDFLDRFDLIIVGFWMPTFFIKIGLNFYLVCHGLIRLMPKLALKPLVFPIAYLTAGCSLWFYTSYNEIVHFNRVWPIVALPFQFGFPLLFYFLLRPKREEAPHHRMEV